MKYCVMVMPHVSSAAASAAPRMIAFAVMVSPWCSVTRCGGMAFPLKPSVFHIGRSPPIDNFGTAWRRSYHSAAPDRMQADLQVEGGAVEGRSEGEGGVPSYSLRSNSSRREVSSAWSPTTSTSPAAIASSSLSVPAMTAHAVG